MAEYYIGQVVLFAGNFAPVGWLACDGSLLPISQYDALYSLLGTTYGGDGQTTFGLPDLRGAVPVSAGQARGRSNYNLGEAGGSESVTVSSTQMPSNTHVITPTVALNVSAAAADQLSPSNNYFGATATDIYNATPGGALNAAVASYATTLAPAGGGQPVEIMNPFLCIRYIVCTEGIYPPQN